MDCGILRWLGRHFLGCSSTLSMSGLFFVDVFIADRMELPHFPSPAMDRLVCHCYFFSAEFTLLGSGGVCDRIVATDIGGHRVWAQRFQFSVFVGLVVAAFSWQGWILMYCTFFHNW